MSRSSSNFSEPDDQEVLSAPRNSTTKRIFIAATRMNDGKTTTSLALFAALRTLTDKVGFIKPVGQRFVTVDGQQIDEDSVLLDEIFKVEVPIQAMSPIAIHPTFTRDFLDNPSDLLDAHINKMCRAFDRAAYEKDYIIIEGTWACRRGLCLRLVERRCGPVPECQSHYRRKWWHRAPH
jgi:dethiobiotin synthetase